MDWIAGALELLGVCLVGSRDRRGFLCCLVCNALWIAVGFFGHVYGLIPVSLAMAVVNTRNFLKWGRNPNAQPEEWHGSRRKTVHLARIA